MAAPPKTAYAAASYIGAMLLTLFAAPVACAQSLTYSPAIEARVVGVDGTPLANALVIANWNIVGHWNGASRGQLAYFEVNTDADGKFRLPAWGPRGTTEGTVTAMDPTLRILKRGYRPLVIHNVEGFEGYGRAPAIIHFRLQGQDIVLTPFGGPGDEADNKAMWDLSESTDVICGNTPPPCKWRRDLMNRALEPDWAGLPDPKDTKR